MPSHILSMPFFARVAVVCIVLTLVLTSALASAQSQSEPTVTISVTNIAIHNGFIMVAIYDETGWGDASITNLRESVHGDTVSLTLTVPNPGRYGIRLFHDVDGNGELNTNIMGIPTEPYGFSNNAPPRFGPPSFKAAAFDIGLTGATQTISLQ